MRENEDRVYVTHVRISRDDEHGETGTEATFVSVKPPDAMKIAEWAKKFGADALVESEVTPFLDLDGLQGIAEWIARVTEKDPAPVIVRPESQVLIDELIRAQRNTDRKLDKLIDVVYKMSPTRYDDAVNPVRAPDPTTASIERAVVKQQRVDDWTEPTPAPASLRRDGRARTAEMGSDDPRSAIGAAPGQGNLNLVGPAPRSEISEVVIGEDGNPKLVSVGLPKVGDSLKPYNMRG